MADSQSEQSPDRAPRRVECACGHHAERERGKLLLGRRHRDSPEHIRTIRCHGRVEKFGERRLFLDACAVTHLLYCMTLLLGVILIFSNFFEQRPSFHIATLTFLPALLSSIRSAIRLIAVTEALPAGRSPITGQAWIYVLLTVLVPFLYAVNSVNSLVTRKIRWRGMAYELIGPGQTRIVPL